MNIEPTVRDMICGRIWGKLQQALSSTDRESAKDVMTEEERFDSRIEYFRLNRFNPVIGIPVELKTDKELIADIWKDADQYWEKMEVVEALVEMSRRHYGLGDKTLPIFWWWFQYGDEPMPSGLFPRTLGYSDIWH